MALHCHCLFLAVFLLLGLPCSQPARILLVPAATKHQVARFHTVATALIGRKHHVTMYLNKAFVPSEKTAQKMNVTDVPMINYMTYDSIVKVGLDRSIAEAKGGGQDTVLSLLRYECSAMLSNELFFEEAAGMELSVAIVDGLFAMRCIYLIPHRLHIPHITLADLEDPWATGNPLLPSFVPVPPLLFSENMSFLQRLTNLRLFINKALANQNPPLAEGIEADYKQIAPYTSLNQLASESLLWAINGDDLIDFPRPKVPFVVDVGGYHISTPKLLQKKLKAFIDNAENGAVVVAIGGVFRDPPKEFVDKLLTACKKLKMRVLIRLTKLPQGVDLPKNVKILPFFSRNDVLGHKKVKVLITDCDPEAQMEAVYNGVPMLGVSFDTADVYNCMKMVRKGYGLSMAHVMSYTSTNVTLNILRVVAADKIFAANIQKASRIFKSRPLPPLRRLVFWVEHVVQFGNDHLVPFSVLLPLYQYIMADLLLAAVGVVLAALLVAAALVYCAVRWCCRKSRGKKEKTTGESKKTK